MQKKDQSKLNKLIQELCPKGVEYRTVGEVCFVTRGRVISKDEIRDNEGDYPVFSSQTNNNGELGKINSYDYDGDYLTWTTDGANAGTVFHRQGKFSITNVCGLLKVRFHNLMTRFLYYVLVVEAPKFVSAGMGNPKLMSNVVSKIPIPVPPLPVQSEIVRILDTFTALTAELTAELTARRKQYEYYRCELLKFVADVEWIKLEEVATFIYGYTDKAKDSGSARFIRITDIDDNGHLNPYDAKYIEIVPENEKYLLQRGDLVMARTGATYGKTLFFDEDYKAIFASFLIKIIPDKSRLLSRFYWHFSKSNLYWEQANSLVTTGGQPQFNSNALKQVKIPIPPLSEQRRIVSILDRFDALCNDLTQGLPAEIEARRKQYEFYRDRLLDFQRKE